MDELQNLKTTIEAHRSKFGKRKAFPREVWEKIYQLSEKRTPISLAEEIGISPANLTRRLKKQKGTQKVSLLEIPHSVIPEKKQMTLELPGNIILRIDL
jgi:hypothetical protein